MNYKIVLGYRGDTNIVKLNDDGSSVAFKPFDDNTDYQEYLAWVAEGNEPAPPDEPDNP
jgi:hypothetical protein